MKAVASEDWWVWHAAALREPIGAAIRTLYTDLDAAVAERGPLCNASGRCCRFEAFGHRLYVTGLEIAWFMLGVRNRGLGFGAEPNTPAKRSADASHPIPLKQLAPTPNPQALTPNCPFQIDGLCSVHTIRPLGCRVFFCERGTEAWQQDTTERFLDRLKQLHADHGLPYTYMEWRAGLAEAAQVFDREN